MIRRTTSGLSRRRVLFIGAMSAGAALMPAMTARAKAPVIQRWNGIALGADASIQLVGVSESRAKSLFAAIETELDRLENIFSLYRAGSVLSRLNLAGYLEAPPPELLEVLSIASSAFRQTGGLFDPSVQPLFALYAKHFANGGAPSGPDPDQLQAALQSVGFDNVFFDAQSVQFTQPGMSLTFNGVAQGYISDRIADFLREAGMDNILVNMGEIVAVGAGPGHTGWKMGIRSGDGEIGRVLVVSDQAVATSAAKGTVLDPDGTVGHIFHPRFGPVPAEQAQVTVVAATAARADALSTAAVLMTGDGVERLRDSGLEIYLWNNAEMDRG